MTSEVENARARAVKIVRELRSRAERAEAEVERLRGDIEALVHDLERDRWLAAYMNNLYDTRARVSRALAHRLRGALSGGKR